MRIALRKTRLAVLTAVWLIACGGQLTEEGEGPVVDTDDPIAVEEPDDVVVDVSDGLIPEDIDRETLDLVRAAIETGLAVGKGLVTDGVNAELARAGIDFEYSGGESMLAVPDDAATMCPYVENRLNDGSTTVSCRLLVEQARDYAYIREADALAAVELGPEFNENAQLHRSWLENGLASGIDGEFVMAVRRLREAELCDQEPTPIQSSYEQGISIGRDLFQSALDAQLAVTPITQCDIDNGIIAPALSSARAQIERTLGDAPLCAGYAPTDMDDRATFHQAENEYAGGVSAGVDEGAVIGAEQLFRTWICQPPAGPPGGGGGDPLVLDLDGDGVSVSNAVHGVMFRLGQAVGRTGWVGDPGDGLLAIDHNANGRIDDGSELFGDASWTADGLPEANGLLTLARYDDRAMGGNGDGVIDERDAVFSALSVWQDRDLDGQTDDGELRSAAAAGVEALELDYVEARSAQLSTFDRVDGSRGRTVDVWLASL